MGRPKVGIFSLSSCEGCLVQILNLEDRLLQILDLIDLVDCRLLGVRKNYDRLDVAIVEGSVMTREDEERIRRIREKAGVLVALGDCACSGGRFIAKDPGAEGQEVKLPRGMRVFRSDPIEKHVRVDYKVYGCPISRGDFLDLLRDLLAGRIYRPPTTNVCAECILRDNDCLLEKGVPCLGPVTRAGCGAACPTVGHECFGCRGLAEDANVGGLVEIMREKGIPVPRFLEEVLEGGQVG